MKLYLMMTGPDPLPAPDRIDPRLLRIAMPPKAGPWRSTSWRSPDATVALFAWSNEPDDPRLVPLLHTDGTIAIGCPGYLEDPRLVDRLAKGHEPASIVDEMSGVFSLFRADASGFTAATGVVRVQPVFHARAGDLHIAGNRALLVHGAQRAAESPAGPAVAYDIGELQSLVRKGYFFNDATAFRGVRALPPHSTLRATRAGATIETRPRSALQERSIDALVDALRSTVAPVRGFSEPAWITLTGGRDSRLIASALFAADIPFRASTRGSPDHPDVVLAARVARLLGVEHRITPPHHNAAGDSLVVEHPLARACRTIRRSEGMLSAHDKVNRVTTFEVSPRISGAGGEVLRGGFLAHERDITPAALARRVRDLFLVSSHMMTAEANDRAHADLEPWAARASDDPAAALDLLYLHHRIGRWSAAGPASSMANHPTFDLLLDNRLCRAALSLPVLWRHTEEPMHRAISVLAPRLANVPLIDKRWRYDTVKPTWPFDRGWRQRAPVSLDREGAGFDWRNHVEGNLLALFRDQVLGGPDALFEIVDRARLEALLDAPPFKKATSVFLWSCYTTSVLLSGAWLDQRPALPPLEIALPRR